MPAKRSSPDGPVGHRLTGGKNLMVQRYFSKLGVPRMYRSSGTDDPDLFRQINEMLTKLAKAEERDIIRQLHEGKRTFLEVFRHFQKKGLDGVAEMANDAPISEEAFEEWLAGHTDKPTTRAAYRASYRTVRKWTKPSMSMRDLPAALERYRASCNRKGRHFRAWNHALAVCKAWVRSTLSARSPVYAELQELKPLKVPKHHLENTYFSPRDVQNVMQKLSPEMAAMVWTMALHGLGPKEYMHDGWKVEGDALWVFGQKHHHRHRAVPLVESPAPVAVPSYRTLYDHLRKASGGVLQPYDLRRCYPRWMLQAGVEWNRVKMYQGHSPLDQTDQYAFHNAMQFLAEDAAKLRTWIAAQLEAYPPSPDVAPAVRPKVTGLSPTTRGAFRPEVKESRKKAKRPVKKQESRITKSGRLLVNGKEPEIYSIAFADGRRVTRGPEGRKVWQSE